MEASVARVHKWKWEGQRWQGGQVEHNYITYINDSSILSACCVTNTASPSPRLCHLVVTTTSKILIISLVNSTKDNDVHWVPIMGHTLGWVLYVPHLIDSLWQLYDIQAFFLLPLYKWENIDLEHLSNFLEVPPLCWIRATTGLWLSTPHGSPRSCLLALQDSLVVWL